jgi:hypothetical protein
MPPLSARRAARTAQRCVNRQLSCFRSRSNLHGFLDNQDFIEAGGDAAEHPDYIAGSEVDA